MFKALSSDTRKEMLKILAGNEMHISGLAKVLKISVPVAAKHVKILEKSGLVERKKFGKTHVLHANLDKICVAFDEFGESFEIKLGKGSTVLDALKEVSGVEIKKAGDKEYITSVDGEEGFYIYEVDGKLPSVSMNKCLLKENAKVELKKLVPVKKKEILIKIR